MSSQYFGFDDDATVSTSCIQKSPPCPAKTAPKPKKEAATETEKLSISQIQALLCQDLTSLDGTLDSSTNETSFYTDEQHYQTTGTLTETAAEDFIQDDTSTIIEEKIEKRPRKVLCGIENQTEINCKTYKKPAKAAAAKKEAKVAKPKKRKAKKENEENEENFDKFAEQINKQFAQVENFQLHVE